MPANIKPKQLLITYMVSRKACEIKCVCVCVILIISVSLYLSQSESLNLASEVRGWSCADQSQARAGMVGGVWGKYASAAEVLLRWVADRSWVWLWPSREPWPFPSLNTHAEGREASVLGEVDGCRKKAP